MLNIKKLGVAILVLAFATLLVISVLSYHKANKTVWFYWLQDLIREGQDFTLVLGSSSIDRLPSHKLKKCQNIVLYGFDNGIVEDISRYVKFADLSNISQLIIYIGENDIARNEDPKVTFAQYNQLINDIRAISSAPIGLIKLKYSPARARFHNQMADFNSLLEKKYQTQRGLKLIPFDEIRQSYYFISDGIHLNKDGNTAFLKMLDKFCESAK